MPVAKTTAFTEADVALAAWAKALGHPARIAILRTLAARGTCVCGDLVEVLPLAQATVSQHLKALREAGLIRGEVEGPRVCYGLAPEAVERLRALLDDLVTGLCDCDCC
ncbi:MAG: metalloregulator ArsR/SmtB family transcription factor [Rhodothermales bacterium]|nr:metalloregulator ArsR/SmtB family transcription factor [Rhodothermales bacterium]